MSALERALLNDSDADSIDEDDEVVKEPDANGDTRRVPTDGGDGADADNGAKAVERHETPPNVVTERVTNASASVKEKLRNNILKHESRPTPNVVDAEPTAKRPRLTGDAATTVSTSNGILSSTTIATTMANTPQKCNGKLPNPSIVAKPSQPPTSQPTKAENGAPPPQSTPPTSSSMTAVA